MVVYITNIFIVFFTLLFSRKIPSMDINIGKRKLNNDSKKTLSKILLAIAFSCIFLVSGLRYNVGTDYNNYIEIFNIIINRKLQLSYQIEPAFILMIKLIALFTNEFLWLFIVTSLFITIFVFKASMNGTGYYELSIFLYMAFGFYTSSFNIIRQWMAASVLLYAYEFLVEGKDREFFKYVFLAICCHYSAIMVIPIYFFIKKPRSNILRTIIFFFGVFLYIITDYIILALKLITSNIGIFNKYGKYLILNENIGGSVLVFPMFCILTYVLYLFYNKNIIRKNFGIEIYINILPVAFAISLIGQKIMVFSRLQMYFLCVLIIVLPQIISSIKKQNRIIVYSIIIVLGTVFFIYSLIRNGGEPLPYQTIFNNIL